MPNNYNTLVNERSSLKFFLVRLKPARDISSLLTLYSGTTYAMILNVPTVPNLEVNGVAYTKVSSLTPSSGQFYFDDITKTLRVNLGTALTSQIVVAYYYLFMTNDVYKRAMENPLDLTGAFYDYDPRIASDAGFTISQNNVMFGTISINSTSLDFKNQDDYFQQFLTDNDSFKNKEVIFWHCLNDVNNIAKVYSGTISNYSLGNDQFSIDIDSDFTKLLQTKFSSTTFEKSFFRLADYPNMDSANDFLPIRKHYQRISKFSHNSDPYDTAFVMAQKNVASADYAGASYLRLKQDTYEGVNIDIGTGVTSNRVWGLYVAHANPQTSGFFISSAVAHFPATAFGWNLYDIVITTPASLKDFTVGDTIFNQSTGNNACHIIGEGPGYITIAVKSTAPAPNNGNAFFREEITQVQIECTDIQKNGENLVLPLVSGFDYNIGTNANGLRTVTLVNNFEANFPDFVASGKTTGIESNYILRYVSHVNNSGTVNLNHADFLKEIILESGLAVNNASFIAAAATDIKLNLSIPFIGDTEMPTYMSIIEKVLESVGGYITLNSANEIEYYLLGAPNSPAILTEDLYMKGSLSQDLKFDDVYSTIKFKNLHGGVYDYKQTNFGLRAGSGIYSYWNNQATIETNQETNNQVKYLHGIQKTIEIEHVIDSLTSTNCFDRIKKLRFNRLAHLKFRTKINNQSKLGDSFQIQSNELMGSNTRNVRLFSNTKRKTDCELEGYDLLGF